MTDEQRARAEANRAAALARRAAASSSMFPRSVPSTHSTTTTTTTTVVAPERCRRLNSKSPRPPGSSSSYVLLWVQSAQRSRHNEALEYAAQRANNHGVPLVAVFGAAADFPGASERHLTFMYEGLTELRATLETTRGIQLLAYHSKNPNSPCDVISAACKGAVECVVDGGYQRTLRQWRRVVAAEAPCAVTEVESEVVVPLYGPGGGAGRPEPAAATLRPKILSRLGALTAKELAPTPLVKRLASADEAVALLRAATSTATPTATATAESAMDPFLLLPLSEGVDACLNALDAASGGGVDRSVRRCSGYHLGGENEAHRKLDVFLHPGTRLKNYASLRNDCGLGLQSHLSPHVHYGQISVVYVVHRAMATARTHPELRKSVDTYVDELVVRRELAINFVINNPKYDAYEGIPGWARLTLAEHSGDERSHVYTAEQFEACATHDKLWNAGQRELVISGKQHNYIRMYWAKKILEWSADPAEGWCIAIHLNNKYSLDGRDPASYTGVGWCWGLHDREFPETSVTGTIRRMSEAGMRGKFNAGVNTYLKRWGDDATLSTGHGGRGGGGRGYINDTSKRSSAAAAAADRGGGGGGGSGTPHVAESRQRRLEEMFFKKPRTGGGA